MKVNERFRTQTLERRRGHIIEISPHNRGAHRRYWAAIFATLLSTTELEVRAHSIALASQVISPSQFGANMLATLQPAHARAYQAGAASMGVQVGTQAAINETAETMSAQADFLRFFMEELQNRDPRYWTLTDDGKEEAREKPITNRALMYAERTRGSANVGLLLGIAPYVPIDWVPGDNEDHCMDCPAWAAAGPYTVDTLPAVPGDGRSECKVFCHCRLRVDGQFISF